MPDLAFPTAEGLRRYPATNGCFERGMPELDGMDRLPCTCTDDCSRPSCSGRCGCEACALATAILLDQLSTDGPDGHTMSLEEGKARFGPDWPNI